MNLEEASNLQIDQDQKQIEAKEQLVNLIREAKRDQSAFYPLYLQFVNRIYFYILGRVGSHQDAEDLCSEVFIRAMKQVHRFNEHNSFAAWLFKIARNLTVDHYRANRYKWLELLEQDLPADQNTPDLEQVLALKEQLSKLDGKEFDLLSLRYAARLTFVEMGQLLGKSPGAIRKAHNKVLDHIRLNME